MEEYATPVPIPRERGMPTGNDTWGARGNEQKTRAPALEATMNANAPRANLAGRWHVHVCRDAISHGLTSQAHKLTDLDAYL